MRLLLVAALALLVLVPAHGRAATAKSIILKRRRAKNALANLAVRCK